MCVALVIHHAIRISLNLLSSVPCSTLSHFLLPVAPRPNADQGLLSLEVSRSHTMTHHSLYVSSWRLISSLHITLRRDRHPCSQREFKPTISAGERPQIHGLYHAASGTRHYLINGKIFDESDTEYMCVLIVSTTLSEVFLILRRIQRYIVNSVYCSSCKYSLFLSDFNKTFRQIFYKSGNISFHRYPSSRSRVIPCGDRETGRRTDMTKLTIAFRNFANKHTNTSQTCITLYLRTFGISFNVEWQ